MAGKEVNQTDVEKTVVAEAPNAEATVLGTPVACPVCGTENSPTEKYCGDCGFLLSSTLDEAGPVVEPVAQATLSGGGREFLLGQGENTVGRSEADILLEDPSVSRKHALVVLEGGSCWVEDLGSTNGTFADGKQVVKGERVQVESGAELKFGSSALMVDLTEAPAAEPVQGVEGLAPGEDESAEEMPEPEMAAAEPRIEQRAEPGESAEEPAAEEPETPAAVARLVGTTEPASEFAIVAGTNRIGRRGDNDIVLAGDPHVSGAHAEIIAEEDKFWLVDVGSTNGTMLNGTRVEPNDRSPLAAGDEIVFGRTVLRFEPAEISQGSGSEDAG